MASRPPACRPSRAGVSRPSSPPHAPAVKLRPPTEQLMKGPGSSAPLVTSGDSVKERPAVPRLMIFFLAVGRKKRVGKGGGRGCDSRHTTQGGGGKGGRRSGSAAEVAEGEGGAGREVGGGGGNRELPGAVGRRKTGGRERMCVAARKSFTVCLEKKKIRPRRRVALTSHGAGTRPLTDQGPSTDSHPLIRTPLAHQKMAATLRGVPLLGGPPGRAPAACVPTPSPGRPPRPGKHGALRGDGTARRAPDRQQTVAVAASANQDDDDDPPPAPSSPAWAASPGVATLPIAPSLPAIIAHLAAHPVLVLEAAPGAGQTTTLPRALALDAGLRVLVVEPRRLAARAAARQMASLLGERVGARVGFRVRGAAAVSAETIVEVVTPGLALRALAGAAAAAAAAAGAAARADAGSGASPAGEAAASVPPPHPPLPVLPRFGAVILDEVHERGVETDACLALLAGGSPLRAARPDLRVVAASATLGGGLAARVAGVLDL